MDLLAQIEANVQWLKENPDFEERPATLLEFLGEDYLAIEDKVRPAIKDALIEIMGEDVNSHAIAKFNLAMITGGIGIGKGGRSRDRVVTPEGWRTYDSLQVGDEVIGSQGTAVKVTGVYPRGKLQMYRVTFTDNSYVDVDGDHLWSVQRRSTGGKWIAEEWDTRWLSVEGRLRTADNSLKYRIPMVKPVEYVESSQPLIDPYTLGVILGDGSITNGSVRISGDDLEIGERIEATYPSLQLRRCQDGRQWTLGHGKGNFDHSIRDGLTQYGLSGLNSHQKFIPEDYMRGSVETRLEILRGLMDSDGGALGTNKLRFSNRNEALCDQVTELVQSLGGTAQKFKQDRGDRGVDFYLNICCPFNPFWLERKARYWKPRTNQPIRRAIKSVTPIDEDEVICISVDAEDQLYVTENFIVTHNTTIASIVLPYLAHWCLCLKDPCKFFNLLPGSRIAFMQMSTSATQAKNVIFGDLKGRINNSPWFKKYPYDKNFKNQMRFPKEIWILPGDSAETTFEGYNILGGILDEADSHKVTETKDYAEQGYTTINSRIESRFARVPRTNPDTGEVTEHGYGFLLVIGQMKKGNGFAAKKYREFRADPAAYALRMSIWESLGWHRFLNEDGERDSFWYHTERHEIVPAGAAAYIKDPDKLIEIPNSYKQSFVNNPTKALRDLAGIPPLTGSPFIALSYKVTECKARWIRRYNDPAFMEEVGEESKELIRGPLDKDNRFAPWFKAPDSLPRVCHLDIAYSPNGDGLGLVMGHVPEMIEIEGERKPYIVIDMMMRIHAPEGREIFLGDVRRIIYMMRDELKFKIRFCTMDGFQSVDTKQQLERRRIGTDIVSVDRTLAPYEDLREAIYENRLDFPEYMVQWRADDTILTEIAVKELIELVDNGKKIDHPEDGSKDVADGLAGVTYTLMGDRTYHRRKTDFSQGLGQASPDPSPGMNPGWRTPDPRLDAMGGARAPLPPSGSDQFGPQWSPNGR